jgi:hypothetical protein
MARSSYGNAALEINLGRIDKHQRRLRPQGATAFLFESIAASTTCPILSCENTRGPLPSKGSSI